MACKNNFSCRNIAPGWREERGVVTDTYSVVKPPVDRPYFFEIWVTGKLDNTVYQLLVNNQIIRDKFKLGLNQTKEYLNGMLNTGERLTLVVEGEAKYKLKWSRKTY